MLSFSVVSVVEDVLRRQGSRLGDSELASKKTDEECMIPLPFFDSIFLSTVVMFLALMLRVWFIISCYSHFWVPHCNAFCVNDHHLS